MTDIPARIMEEAWRVYQEGENDHGARLHHIATALLAAEQRARKEALEEAAKVAERLLTFADTTSDADKALPAAIRAASPT